MDRIIVPEGTVVQYMGVPLELELDTVMLGDANNFFQRLHGEPAPENDTNGYFDGELEGSYG